MARSGAEVKGFVAEHFGNSDALGLGILCGNFGKFGGGIFVEFFAGELGNLVPGAWTAHCAACPVPEEPTPGVAPSSASLIVEGSSILVAKGSSGVELLNMSVLIGVRRVWLQPPSGEGRICR